MRFIVSATVLLIFIASALGNDCDVGTVLTKSNKIFTVNVYKELVKQFGDENFIFSGLSAETVLSLLANGARGSTLSQLLKGLNLPDNLKIINNAYKQLILSLKIDEEDTKLLLANKIYPAECFTISDEFNGTALEDYDSEVEKLDYGQPKVAARLINQWVEQQTNNKIKDLIDPTTLSPSTSLVLVNALYFTGRWQHEFKIYHTKKRNFMGSTGTKQIDTMFTEALSQYSYSDKLKAKFLELNIQSQKASVVFILPDSLNGLGEIEKNLAEYLEKQQMESALVAITLPKFTITSEIDFKPILQSLGVEDVFTPTADLTGISKGSNLAVDFVLQKAFISIKEEGVEAAASSAIGVNRMSALSGEVKHTFTADHPFLFYIREHKYDQILFVGRFNQ